MSNYVNLMDVVYPIGSIYVSMNGTSPAEIVGGTWTQIIDKFLRPSDTSLTEIGSNSHYHTIDGTVACASVDFYRGENWLNIFYTSATTAAQYSKAYVQKHAYRTNEYNSSSDNFYSYPVEVKGRTRSNYDYIPLSMTCYCWYRTA